MIFLDLTVDVEWARLLLTGVAGFAAHSEVHVALLCSLLHQLYYQLVRLAHHGCAVHAYQFIARPQASVLVRCSILHYVADVDLKHKKYSGELQDCSVCTHLDPKQVRLAKVIDL